MIKIHKEIASILENHKAHSKFKTFHRLYKDTISVIDFKDHYLALALDIGLIENQSDMLSIKTIFRNKETERLFEQKKECPLSMLIKRTALSNELPKIISNIYSAYDTLYKYKISIIVPTFNRAGIMQSMLETLNTVKNKDCFEVIFVDDCSTDDTIDVIKNTLSTTVNYRIYQLPINSGGASIPRNLGIRVSLGEYVLFMDSDDNIFDYTIKDVIDYIEQTDCDILYCKPTSSTGRKLPVRAFSSGTVENADIIKNHLLRTFSASFRLFRSSLINHFGISFPNFKAGEDRIFTLSCISDAKKISILADKPYFDIAIESKLSLNKSKNTSKYTDFISKHFMWFDIISRSDADFIYKLKMFNGVITMVFDDLKNNIKMNNINDIVSMYIKRIHSLGFVIMKDCIYKENIEIYNLFKQFDTLNVTR